MQREIPPESLSRVSSYDALGSLLLGPSASCSPGPRPITGARPSLIACGVVMIVVSAAVLLVPGVRELRSRARNRAAYPPGLAGRGRAGRVPAELTGVSPEQRARVSPGGIPAPGCARWPAG